MLLPKYCYRELVFTRQRIYYKLYPSRPPSPLSTCLQLTRKSGIHDVVYSKSCYQGRNWGGATRGHDK